ncbi:MAG: S9 family peptidase [Acidobacteria bacterium]|nr:S9 family peptidase [Acidobacteriota bacterium]
MRQTPGFRTCLMLAVVVTATLVAQPNGKRPLTHRDYDSWRSISSQKLSDDGRYLAYALMPQEGDGEVVVKDLQTGAEQRQPIGARPAVSESRTEGEPGEPGTGPPGGAAGGRGISLSFTSDGRYLVFTTYPSKAETEKARKARKRPEEMPKGGLIFWNLSGGEPTRVANVRSFQLAENAPQWLAYLKEPEPSPEKPAEESKESKQDQRRQAAQQTSTGARRTEYGSELVLRNLQDSTERKYADVAEYSLAKDGNTLVYAVSSRKEETNGAYAVATSGAQAKALASGKGKYQRLTWDEKQAQLAFLSSRDDSASRQPKYKLYLWQRGSGAAEAVVSDETPGMREGWEISERGALSFSKDGARLFLGTSPARPARTDSQPGAEASEERVVADLWHWKDENVQAMQKVQAEAERNRSHRAVYLSKDRRLVQLADVTMRDLTLTEDSRRGIGSDSREYRPMVEYDDRYSDYYLVDADTGARTLLLRKHRGSLVPSPDGKYAVTFDGLNWLSIDLGTRKTVNLTGGIGVAFHDEDEDTPGSRSPFGLAGWTKDSKHVLLYDQYDVWQAAPDGTEARNLTDGVGRREKIRFRYVRMDEQAAPFFFGSFERAASIDPAKPVLLRAENVNTRDSGFWEDRIDAGTPPMKLVMAAKSFSTPVKARKADVLLLSAQRFDEFGDLLVTDPQFSHLRKVTNANPQKEQMLWGTGELIRYRNSDGVPLSAALYKPANFDPNKKHPLLVHIYERLSQSLHSFRAPAPGTSINISYYVSNGYLVLTPDIAYTVGYPGQSALKCVLPAIQAVVDRGYVNENAIGIQGHSWGGYQIAYMVTETNRFRAAAAGAPVSNMISAYDGIRWESGRPRQFQYERSQSRIGGSIWTYPTRFIENSPIFHADRVRTPLLMVHNDNDGAVPWYQGIEYFLALRRLGKEVYMFNYNGEAHGLRRRPNQKDYTMRMQQFFDHHLKGAPKPEWMERGIPYLEREQEKEKWGKTVEGGVSGGVQ